MVIKRLSAILLLLSVSAWLPSASASGSMRCNGRIVSNGMSAAGVLAACGEPDYRDIWNQAGGGSLLGDEEEWYYNFGSNQLLRVLHLRGGSVSDISTDGYGYDDRPNPPCDPGRITEGMTKFRLVMLCGAPLTRRVQSLVQPYDRYGRPGYDPRGYYSPVYREEWTYNFGSAYLMRRVTLENGRVTDVQNSERGTD